MKMKRDTNLKLASFFILHPSDFILVGFLSPISMLISLLHGC